MPRDFFVELTWRCVNNHQNKGDDTVCSTCGAPKQDVDADEMPAEVSEADAVQDPKKLSHAQAGPGWKCRYCGAVERREDGNCVRCGVDQARGEKRDETPTTASLASSHKVKFSARPQPLFPILIAVGITGFIVCMWLLFRTKELHGTVTALAWQRTIHVDRYTLRSHEGFNEDGAEQTGALHVRVIDTHRYHYTRHVAVGSHLVTDSDICGTRNCRKGPPHDCYTPKRECTKLKNGYAKCTQPDEVCRYNTLCDPKTCSVTDYRDIPVYDTFYTWDQWEWRPEREAIASGTNLQVNWPDVTPQRPFNPGEQERERGREETFEVSLTGRKGDTWTYHPASEGDFQRFSLGGRHLMKVNAAGSVVVEN